MDQLQSFVDCWDSSSDSDPDDGADFSSELFDELVSRGEVNHDARSWTYLAWSDRGAEMFGGLSKRRVPDGGFKLEFNPIHKMLLNKAKVKVTNSLAKARAKLNLDNSKDIDHGASFAAVIPRHFVELFHDYLKTSLKPNKKPTWCFSDICAFLHCEATLRFYCASESELQDYGVSADVLFKYGNVGEGSK